MKEDKNNQTGNYTWWCKHLSKWWKSPRDIIIFWLVYSLGRSSIWEGASEVSWLLRKIWDLNKIKEKMIFIKFCLNFTTTEKNLIF